ncbi:MAG: cobalamin B12-binding domain-containing protein [Deltaproteobacteria bacterium]|nr:cobalamin B12-binding domain-containing protein [Deltaproteobacteria bacterium]
MNHRQRLLTAVLGDMPDHIPYAPRIDLWYNANSLNGTLPQRHQGRTRDQIALSEGWALHKVVADHLRQPNPDAMLHRALGVHFMKEYVAHFAFSDQVKIETRREGDRTRIRYTTAKGSITTCTVYSPEMRRSGTSVPWIEEHAVKTPDDLMRLAGVFENMDVVANYEAFAAHQAEVAENGLPVTAFTVAAGPLHHIQKYFLDATEFFHYYRDHQPERLDLADALAPLYAKALRIVADSPAEVIQWGSNFDDMLTFPPMFAQHFVPWIRKAKEVLGPKNIRVLCHTDGENLGLMDLLHESGMDVAEAVCPAPMTKVTIQEYYRRWSDRITIFGGVPSNLLLPQLTPDEQFQGFMDGLFSGIGDGRRFILGIADTTPPDADFERLVRIGDMVGEKGRLPLQAGAFNPVDTGAAARVLAQKQPAPAPRNTRFANIRQAVLDGREQELIGQVKELLQRKVAPKDIIDLGMVAAMESLNEAFKNGTVFIPEVLAAARAMNAAVLFLEPYLAEKDKRAGGKILIGTVKGDMHDIGKNMVATMLRGVGFNVVDLGINVAVDAFVKKVAGERPQVLALSALLTTTMPEMRKVIAALSQAGIREGVKVIIGGAPVNRNFADDIGADGYARDAAEAIDLVRSLIG